MAVPLRPPHAADKVTFGTNWLAEAEHGGYYQALADGTYAKYGLDVTIVQGGPQANNGSCCWPGARFLHGRQLAARLRRRGPESADRCGGWRISRRIRKA